MNKSKIKICGITNLADAELAVGLGADLLGFNFYRPSPRYLSPEAAVEIVSELPDSVTTVAVTVNMGADDLKRILDTCRLDMIQLHGDETADQCRAVRQLGVGVIKAIRIRRPDDIGLIDNFDVDAFLLDAFREDLYGGTGDVFDWNWINTETHGHVFLAGGITPDNITEALKISTYGVDLCSGVESEPGKKDADKMKLLFERINTYNKST